MIPFYSALSAASAALSIVGSAALAQDPPKTDLSQLSLEDLMRMEVSVSSRRTQSFRDVPAAVYVITNEDIRRSSAGSIPELLRGVPGMVVAKIDHSTWMVSARGFNGRFANKLLVLIDGQSVYTPLFNGTWWDLIDLPLEEIERIEIVRGSGGSLWGTNAVNGTINIITKHATSTLGGVARVGSGTQGPMDVYAGFGDNAGESGSWRVYANAKRELGSRTISGLDAGDRSDIGLGGRYDVNVGTNERFSFGVAAANSEKSSVLELPIWTGSLSEEVKTRGHGNRFSARMGWDRNLGEKGQDAAILYFENYGIKHTEVGEKRTTIAAEFNSSRQMGGGHKGTFGVGLKTTSDETEGTQYVTFDPGKATVNYFSAFINDEFALSPKLRADLTLKLEATSLQKPQLLPTARFAYAHSEDTLIWFSGSRAMRSPSRAESGVDIDIEHRPSGGPPIAFHLVGNRAMKPEIVDSVEAGVRLVKSENLLFDFAAFYNQYRELRTFEMGASSFETDPVPHVRQEFQFGNGLNAQTAGVELSMDYRKDDGARFMAAYSLFAEKFWLDSGSTDPFTTTTNERAGITPKHQLTFRASLPVNPASTVELDLYSVSKLAWDGWGDYLRLDAQYKTKFESGMALGIGVRNLLGNNHREGRQALYEVPSKLPTEAFVSLSWRF